jgi:hypothetical protein
MGDVGSPGTSTFDFVREWTADAIEHGDIHHGLASPQFCQGMQLIQLRKKHGKAGADIEAASQAPLLGLFFKIGGGGGAFYLLQLGCCAHVQRR